MNGKLIELKPFERHHIAKLVEWRNDPEVAYWSAGGEPEFELITAEEAENFFSSNVKNASKLDSYMFAIYTLKGEHIGVADYRDVERIKRSCTIGVMIGEKDYWGKGYGTDAIRVLTEYLFNGLNIRRIQLDTWSGNERAVKAYRKCGFTEEGRLRENEYVKGKFYDTIIMGLLRSQWENR